MSLLALLPILSSPAHAGCEVPTLLDYDNLQEAVDYCPFPAEITLGSAYTPVLDRDGVIVTRDVVIEAGGAALPAIAVEDAELVLRDGIAAIPGLTGAALWAERATLVVERTEFLPSNGYAVDAHDSDVTIRDVDVVSFRSAAVFRAMGSGAPYTFTLEDSSISDSEGHAVWLDGVDATLNNVEFSANFAEIGGADVKATGGGRLEASGLRSTGASTAGSGGSIYARDVDVYLDDARFDGSSAAISGGAVDFGGDVGRPELTVIAGRFDGTGAAVGGAVAVWEATAYFDGVDALHTNALERGGFVYARNATVKLAGGQVVAASARDEGGVYGEGGAVYASSSSVITSGARLAGGNGPDAEHGGLVFLEASSFAASGGTLELSGATAKGGGIYAMPGGSVQLTGATLHGLWAGRGGGVYADRADVYVTDSASDTVTASHQGGFVWQLGARLVIDGLNARGGSGPGGGAVVYTEAPVALDVGRVRACGSLGYGQSAAGVIDVVGRPVEDSRIHHDVFYGSVEVGAAVRYTSPQTSAATGRLLVHDNDFVDNDALAADLVIDGDGAEATNNLFYGSSVAALSVGREVGGGYPLYYRLGGAEVVGAGIYGAEGAVRADPRFVGDPAISGCETDLHLLADSPAIDAGDPALEDAAGGPSDIGVYDHEALPDDTDAEDPDDTDVDSDPQRDSGDAFSGAQWTTGGGGCRTAGGAPPVAALLAALALLGRRRARQRAPGTSTSAAAAASSSGCTPSVP